MVFGKRPGQALKETAKQQAETLVLVGGIALVAAQSSPGLDVDEEIQSSEWLDETASADLIAIADEEETDDMNDVSPPLFGPHRGAAAIAGFGVGLGCAAYLLRHPPPVSFDKKRPTSNGVGVEGSGHLRSHLAGMAACLFVSVVFSRPLLRVC